MLAAEGASSPTKRMKSIVSWRPQLVSSERLDAIRRNWRVLLSHFIIWSISITLALTSIILSYLAFYRWYVPAERTSVPVYFQYDQTTPSHSMSITKVHTAVAYDISLQVTVPDIAGLAESLGNVMIKARLESGSEMSISSRPTLLLYRSQVTRMALLGLRLLPVLMGIARESSVHRIFLFEDITVPDSSLELVVSMDHKVPIYDATLEMVAHFTGLRYLMYYWRWTFAGFIIGALSFAAMFAITIITSISLYLRLRSAQTTVAENGEQSTEGEIVIESDESEKTGSEGSLMPASIKVLERGIRRRQLPKSERQVPHLEAAEANSGGSDTDSEDSESDLIF